MDRCSDESIRWKQIDMEMVKIKEMIGYVSDGEDHVFAEPTTPLVKLSINQTS